jgi:hypothetical protein
LSAAVLEKSSSILWKHPGIFLVIFFQFLMNVIFSTFSRFLGFLIYSKELHSGYFVWVVFMFYWTQLFFSYVLYVCVIGVGGTVYFLEGTEYMPKSPTESSFKRAATTSGGSSAFAAFIVAIIETLKIIVRSSQNSDNSCCRILSCCALCVLCILECIFKFIAHYGLIYCGLFGVPFFEGCQRFAKLQFTHFIDVLIGGNVISMATNIYIFFFSLLGAFGGLLIAFLIYHFNYYYMIFLPVFAFVFSVFMMKLVNRPLESLTDTLFICFVESPFRFFQMSPSISNLLREYYEEGITKKINQFG